MGITREGDREDSRGEKENEDCSRGTLQRRAGLPREGVPDSAVKYSGHLNTFDKCGLGKYGLCRLSCVSDKTMSDQVKFSTQ